MVWFPFEENYSGIFEAILNDLIEMVPVQWLMSYCVKNKLLNFIESKVEITAA